MNFNKKDLEQMQEYKREKDSKNNVTLNIDSIIHKLQTQAIKNGNQRIKISQQEFIKLCRQAKKIFMAQPTLLKLQGPIFICTGTLGSYYDLAQLFKQCGHPKFMNYLFLGDYVGHYDSSLECLVALLAYKLFMPNNFFMIKGCNQIISILKSSKLQNHLVNYFDSPFPFLEVCQLFCCLPYGAIVQEGLLCIHGGIGPFLESPQQIGTLPRPLDNADRQVIRDLLFADPTNLYQGWTENGRGVGVSFGADVVQNFVRKHHLKMICRAHQVPLQGFRFFSEKFMVTICSLPRYLNQLNNGAAVCMVDDKNNILFKLIADRDDYTNINGSKHMSFKVIMDIRAKNKTKQKQSKKQIVIESNKKLRL